MSQRNSLKKQAANVQFSAALKTAIRKDFFIIFDLVALLFSFFPLSLLFPNLHHTYQSGVRRPARLRVPASPFTESLFTARQPTARRYRHHDRTYRVFKMVLMPATQPVWLAADECSAWLGRVFFRITASPYAATRNHATTVPTNSSTPPESPLAASGGNCDKGRCQFGPPCLPPCG